MSIDISAGNTIFISGERNWPAKVTAVGESIALAIYLSGDFAGEETGIPLDRCHRVPKNLCDRDGEPLLLGDKVYRPQRVKTPCTIVGAMLQQEGNHELLVMLETDHGTRVAMVESRLVKVSSANWDFAVDFRLKRTGSAPHIGHISSAVFGDASDDELAHLLNTIVVDVSKRMTPEARRAYLDDFEGFSHSALFSEGEE